MWPWPGDTPLDRARRIALSYREALYARDPDAGMALDDQSQQWGEHWVSPVVDNIDLEAWVTVDVAASHVGLTAKAVYQWVYNGDLPAKKCNDKRVRVKLIDALDVNRELRQRRASRTRGAA